MMFVNWILNFLLIIIILLWVISVLFINMFKGLFVKWFNFMIEFWLSCNRLWILMLVLFIFIDRVIGILSIIFILGLLVLELWILVFCRFFNFIGCVCVGVFILLLFCFVNVVVYLFVNVLLLMGFLFLFIIYIVILWIYLLLSLICFFN